MGGVRAGGGGSAYCAGKSHARLETFMAHHDKVPITVAMMEVIPIVALAGPPPLGANVIQATEVRHVTRIMKGKEDPTFITLPAGRP